MKPVIKITTQLIILLSGFLLTACQQDNHSTNGEHCMQLTAGQAATQIITIYRQSIKKTIELVKDQPDGDTIKEEFEELLNGWQTNLLTIGQHIMVMTESEKNQIERAINMEHMNMQYDDHAKQQFTDYSLGIFPYHSTHPNL